MSSPNQEWSEATDPSSGRTYYYNKVTKETSWKRPPEMDAPQKPAPVAVVSATEEMDPNDVASNWATSTDPSSQRTYYYNKVTKKTQWTSPACLSASVSSASQPPVASVASAAAGASTNAPTPASTSATASPASDVWRQTTDPTTGRPYWYNRVTKETTWRNPNEEPEEDEVNVEFAAYPRASTLAEAKNAAATEHVNIRKLVESDDEKEDDSKPDKRDIRHLLRDDSDDEDDGKTKSSSGSSESSQSEMMNVKKVISEREVADHRKKLDQEEEVETQDFRFAKHRHGFINRFFRIGQIHDDSTLLTYKKSLIKKALLKQNRELDEEAVQAFKNIMSYMGDRKSSKEPIEHAKKLLRNLMAAPSGLRDEVYMQICKQTTKNPKVESTIKGWQLMSFCLATFPPSKSLKGFLTDFIKKHVEDADTPTPIQDIAKVCIERIPKIVVLGQRKQVPSTLELQCLIDNKSVPIRVNMVNGQYKSFNVDPYTLCRDVEEMMVQKLSLTVSAPFALYESAEANVERLLEPKDRVLDVLASWENKPIFDEIKKDDKKSDKLDKNAPEVKVLKDARYTSFLYKAKLVLKTTNKELMSDPEAVNMIYIQAVSDVVTQRYPANEKDITVLAALQLQSTFGDYRKDTHVPGWLKPRIEEFMPKFLIEKKGKLSDTLVSEWEQKILAKYMKVAGFSALEAKLNYLDYIQEWVFYGATFFVVEQRQFKDYPSSLTMGINCEGVILMHPEKKTVLENYAYTDIVTWGHSDEKFIIVVGNIVQQRKLIFKTGDGKVMNQLIHDYVKFKVKNREVGA